MFFSQKICSIHFSCVNLSQQNTKNMNNTYKVSDFLVERNKKIVERFKEVKPTHKRDEAINIVAAEFGLSYSSIDFIVYPRKKNTNTVPNS